MVIPGLSMIVDVSLSWCFADRLEYASDDKKPPCLPNDSIIMVYAASFCEFFELMACWSGLPISSCMHIWRGFFFRVEIMAPAEVYPGGPMRLRHVSPEALNTVSITVLPCSFPVELFPSTRK